MGGKLPIPYPQVTSDRNSTHPSAPFELPPMPRRQSRDAPLCNSTRREINRSRNESAINQLNSGSIISAAALARLPTDAIAIDIKLSEPITKARRERERDGVGSDKPQKERVWTSRSRSLARSLLIRSVNLESGRQRKREEFRLFYLPSSKTKNFKQNLEFQLPQGNVKNDWREDWIVAKM